LVRCAFHLAILGFPGYSHHLATDDFLRKLPTTNAVFRFTPQTSLPNERSVPFLCRPSDSPAKLSLRWRFCGILSAGTTFYSTSFGLPFPTALRLPFQDSPSRFPCGSLGERLHQVGGTIDLSIHRHPEYFPTLASHPFRERISFKDFLELTPHIVPDLFATTLKRTLSSVWPSGLRLDCSSVVQTPTHPWRGSCDPTDLASNSLKNLGRFHHFWVTSIA
jgi:hypothetical protein